MNQSLALLASLARWTTRNLSQRPQRGLMGNRYWVNGERAGGVSPRGRAIQQSQKKTRPRRLQKGRMRKRGFFPPKSTIDHEPLTNADQNIGYYILPIGHRLLHPAKRVTSSVGTGILCDPSPPLCALWCETTKRINLNHEEHGDHGGKQCLVVIG